ELPSQWRGFLLDQRALRNIALKPTGRLRSTPERNRYEAALAQLVKTAGGRPPTAEGIAAPGAVYLGPGGNGQSPANFTPAQRRRNFTLCTARSSPELPHRRQLGLCLSIARRSGSSRRLFAASGSVGSR